MLYRQILKKSWDMIWRNKYLWFFGLFATLWGGGGGYEIIAKSSGTEDVLNQWYSSVGAQILNRNIFSNLIEAIKTDPMSVIIIIFGAIVLLFLFCFFTWLAIISKVALINNVYLAANKKSHSFTDGFSVGQKKFWPVFSLALGVKLIIALAFAVLGLGFILSNKIIYVIAFVILMVGVILLASIFNYATAFITIKNQNLTQAISEAYKLFIKNWLASLEMALVLIFVSFIGSLILLYAIFIIFVPFAFFIANFLQVSTLLVFLLSVAGLIIILGIAAAGGALLTSFQISAWTIFFMELTKNTITSKIIRVTNSVSSYLK
jgi:hypothetical protein